MADDAEETKIKICNYGEAIDEEILRLQKISTLIDATIAESVISKSKEATDNDNIKKKTAVKRKKTLPSKHNSNPTHTENVNAPQDDIIEPQFKISKFIGNYITDNEKNIDKSVQMPIEVEEFEKDFYIQNVGHSQKNSKIRKDLVKSELESTSYKSTSASRNIKESSGDTDEPVGSAQITDKLNPKDNVITLNNKTKAQSLVKLIEMTTNDTEQLLKSIDNLEKDTDNLSSTEGESLESISKSHSVQKDPSDAILVENEKPIAYKDLLNDPAESILVEKEKYIPCKDSLDDPIKPILDKHEKHVAGGDTYVFDIDYVLKIAEESFRSSTDPADKKLEIYFRSYWCRPQVIFEETPSEKMLQDSIVKWRSWQNMTKPRETPVSYKCYICLKAWWHLSDFRDHIHIHNEHNLKVDIEKSSFECSIISYLGNKREPEDIYIEGKCWKCGYGYEEHTLEERYYDSLYTCYKCNEKFYTCTTKRYHEDRCEKYRNNHLLVEKCKEFSYECEQCAAAFNNTDSLYEHQVHRHCVRSDIPAVAFPKVCKACKVLHTCYSYHTCTKKLEIAICKHCGKNFYKPFLAVTHMNLTKSNVKCDFCERILAKECLMMEHLIMEHSVNFMLVYRCRICPKPVLMRTPLAIARHRKKCHSKVKCNVTIIVPIPKKCLPDLDATKDSSLHKYKKNESIETITDTVKEQDVIEIVDSDEEDEKDDTNNIKTEIFEAEDNELQMDEDSKNSIDIEENKISINYDHVDNEQIHDADNLNVANELTYNDDIKVKHEIVDVEYEKELHINIKKAPEECDSEDLEIMKEENELERHIQGHIKSHYVRFQAFNEDPSTAGDQKDGDEMYKCQKCQAIVVRNQFFEHWESHVDIITENKNTNVVKQEINSDETANSDRANIRLQAINEDPSTAGTKKDCDEMYKCQKCQALVVRDQFFEHWECNRKSIAEKKNTNVVRQEINSDETINSDGQHALLDPAMLQTVLSTLQSTDLNALKSTGAYGEYIIVKHTCCVCSREFRKYNDAKRHLVEHLVEDATVEKINYRKKKFRCQICNAKYPKKNKFRLHLREHASLPNFTCDICNKSFSDSSNFNKHKKVHNRRLVICDICYEEFQTKASLEEHMSMVHSTDPITNT